MDRDILIMNCLERFSFLLGRHIKMLFFDGTRACDRRLKILYENEYLKRQKILYGVPSLFSLTNKGKRAINASVRDNKIRVEQIQHDIAVLDTVIYFIEQYKIQLDDIKTEKQLHQLDGFGTRKHQPDFIYIKDKKTYSVEVELSLKAKERLEKNIVNNFFTYDFQIWIAPDNQYQITKILKEHMTKYTNIEIISLEEVQSYIGSIRNIGHVE